MNINHDTMISNLELDRIGELLQARLAKEMDEDPRNPSVLKLIGAVIVLICLEEDMVTGYIQHSVTLAALVEVKYGIGTVRSGHGFYKLNQHCGMTTEVLERIIAYSQEEHWLSSIFVKYCQPVLSSHCSAGSALIFLVALSSLLWSLLNSYRTS